MFLPLVSELFALKGWTRFGFEGGSRSSFPPIASMYFAVDCDHYAHAIDVRASAPFQLHSLR